MTASGQPVTGAAQRRRRRRLRAMALAAALDSQRWPDGEEP